MRRWGLLVTFFYGFALALLVVPATVYFVAGIDKSGLPGFLGHVREAYALWGTWIVLAIPLAGQALLLFLRVDTTQRRLKPRTRIVVSAVTTGLFLTVLTAGIIFSLMAAVKGDYPPQALDRHPWPWIVGGGLFFWILWGVIFARVTRDSADPVTRAVSWLLRGSVLELLIAVPAHVITRRRQDCSAPTVTGFGISSGIAIMLLSFGPSVLVLLKKRMESHTRRAAAGS